LVAFGALLLLTSSVEAQVWDASFDFGARSYPWGAAFGAEGGYGVPIWGDTSELAYGFTRVGARAQTSGVVQRLDAKLSVFPISFFGVELQSGWGHRRLDDISTLDCVLMECSGSLTRTTLQTPLYFGFEKIFGRARLAYTWISASEVGKTFLADESTSLAVMAAGDQIRRWDFLVGLKLREDIRTMAIYELNEAQKSGEGNLSYGLVGQKSWGPHALLAGAGVYDSSTTSPHLQLLAAYVFTFRKGLGY
jgi:hypothetical protein